jgi:hypothetical protein
LSDHSDPAFSRPTTLIGEMQITVKITAKQRGSEVARRKQLELNFFAALRAFAASR